MCKQQNRARQSHRLTLRRQTIIVSPECWQADEVIA
jgi:hypothetical protein